MSDDRRPLLDAVHGCNEEQKRLLDAAPLELHQCPFDQLDRDLLAGVGNTSATVASQAANYGIDGATNVQVGNSSVREVVQAKRVSGNPNRRVLDERRVVQPLHRAIRVTVIVTCSSPRLHRQGDVSGSNATPLAVASPEPNCDCACARSHKSEALSARNSREVRPAQRTSVQHIRNPPVH